MRWVRRPSKELRPVCPSQGRTTSRICWHSSVVSRFSQMTKPSRSRAAKSASTIALSTEFPVLGVHLCRCARSLLRSSSVVTDSSSMFIAPRPYPALGKSSPQKRRGAFLATTETCDAQNVLLHVDLHMMNEYISTSHEL